MEKVNLDELMRLFVEYDEIGDPEDRDRFCEAIFKAAPSLIADARKGRKAGEAILRLNRILDWCAMRLSPGYKERMAEYRRDPHAQDYDLPPDGIPRTWGDAI